MTTGQALRAELDAMSADEQAAFFASLNGDDKQILFYNWDVWARESQRMPEGDWYLWKILAGRGFGKTRTGAQAVVHWAETPGTRIALIGRIPKDVRRVMVEGESGILACSPPWFKPKWEPAKGQLTWPNGSVGETFTSEVPDDLRGPQFHKAWIDEWCKYRWPVEVWDMLMLCLRLGEKPQVVSTTTPRPSKLLREMLRSDTTRVSTGSTFENAANLPAVFLQQIKKRFEGTSLGQQELFAMILDDVAGALWNRELLDLCRVQRVGLPKMVKTVLAVDPSVTSEEDSDETGLALVGLGEDEHCYVLEDYSRPGAVHLHAKFIIQCWRDGLCDYIVAEKNNGGDLIEHTLRQTQDPKTMKPAGFNLPFQSVHASRGKRSRAEPVSMLYQQKRVHHVGIFAELEDQLTSWVPDVSPDSPDRLDALVWAVSNLAVTPEPVVRVRSL